MENKDALVLIMARNAFYKRLHYLALGAFALSIVVIAVLISVYVYLKKNPTIPVYFATDNVGRLVTIVPLNKPNMSTEEVAQWAVDAIEAAYSFDFLNFRSQLQKAEKYFTTYGWKEYSKALKASNNLVAVRERRMISIAKAVDKPQLINQGILGDRYAWQFKIPLLVVNQYPPYDQNSRFANAYEISITIRRENVLDSYQGLGIIQIIGKAATNNSIPPPDYVTSAPQ